MSLNNCLLGAVFTIFFPVNATCFGEYIGNTIGTFNLSAKNRTSSEYKGPITASFSSKLFSDKILFISVLFLPVSKTSTSISTPCSLRESIAIVAPKYKSVTIFANLLFSKISSPESVSNSIALKGSKIAILSAIPSSISSL